MEVFEYNINNNGEYECNWNFPIFSLVKVSAEEFKAVIEKAHDELLKEYEEYWIGPEDIAKAIVEMDDRFFHSTIHITAFIDGWGNEEDWSKKFQGVRSH